MTLKSPPVKPPRYSTLDLRAPVLARVRRGTGVRWLRILSLILQDTTVLFLAWQVAATIGTPVHSFWNTRLNPLSLLPILAIQVGSISIQGLYSSGQKRRDYFSLIKTLNSDF